jgi:hypothetical protein
VIEQNICCFSVAYQECKVVHATIIAEQIRPSNDPGMQVFSAEDFAELAGDEVLVGNEGLVGENCDVGVESADVAVAGKEAGVCVC